MSGVYAKLMEQNAVQIDSSAIFASVQQDGSFLSIRIAAGTNRTD